MSIRKTLQRLHVSLHTRYMAFLNVLHYGKLRAMEMIVRRSRRDVPAALLERQKVSVVICVHNALADVRKCLASVMERDAYIHEIIIVDDGSDGDTASYLQTFAADRAIIKLIRHEEPVRYTRAANVGLQASDGDFVVLLNSDTIVAAQWLEGLLRCALSDAHIGIVGPLGSTASWQSVPQVFASGTSTNAQDWAHNELPKGFTPESWAAAIREHSLRLYPRLPFLNGFCLLIRRAVIDQIGYFDAENFAQGYGEENDYCVRARAAQWQLAVADDVYVTHMESRSYSHDTRRALSEKGSRTLARKHGANKMIRDTSYCEKSPVMQRVRQNIRRLMTL